MQGFMGIGGGGGGGEKCSSSFSPRPYRGMGAPARKGGNRK